jgi:hypothetical protein
LSKKQGGPSNRIPPDTLKRLGEKITAQARGSWERVTASLPDGVKAEAMLDAVSLTMTYAFTHDRMGELGRIDARFTGDGLSLSQICCGITVADDAFAEARESMMLRIYESAKAAFGEEGR